MKKFVIYLIEGDTKGYFKLDNGESKLVSGPSEATALPNRVVAASVCQALRPAIKKQGFDVIIGVECI